MSSEMTNPHSFILFRQTWKNETVAEQKKRSAKERPVLLSKDIESKLGLLDREVNYLLNKAKFAKPKSKAKAKDGANAEKNGKSNTTAEEKVIPPSKEAADEEKSGLNASQFAIHPADQHRASIDLLSCCVLFFLLSCRKPGGSEARRRTAGGRERRPHGLGKPIRAHRKRSNYRSVCQTGRE